MAIKWIESWRTRITEILRHPWRSLVSLLAGIGDFVLWIEKLLWHATLWIVRELGALFSIPLWRLLRGLAYALVILAILATAVTFFLINYPSTKVPHYEPVDQHVYISQGWGWTGGQQAPLRQLFYYTPQGAGLKDIRYSWFVNLEVPWGSQKFADPQRMSAYGFLVDNQPTEMNPDRLPVGFSAHYDPRFGENVLDLTCAACHTGELVVSKNGKRYGLRVDGAGAMHAFTAMHVGDFAPELTGALTATYLNPFKFARFAKAVLGPTYPEGVWRLHGQLRQVIGRLGSQVWNENIRRNLYPTEEGPGRIDALGRIANTVFGEELTPTNYGLSNAPVRYPPLWDIWKFDHVQYNSSVRQPMTRNVSESLGTGATAQLLNLYGAPIPGDQRFDTSVQMDNLADLEMALWSLEPPKWSEDCMGKIDWARAKRGRDLFEATCRHCHGPFPASDPIKQWYAYLKADGYQPQVRAEWQDFLNSFYRGSRMATPSGDVEDRGEVSNSSMEMAASAPSPSAKTGGPSLSFTPLEKPAGGEETQEGALRTPGPPRPLVDGTAPIIPDNVQFPLWVMHPLTVQDIGTDPTTAVNFVDKTIDVTKAGLSPTIANQGMRDLLQEDLKQQISGYARDILELLGRKEQYRQIVGVSPRANAPETNQLTDAQHELLKNAVANIIEQPGSNGEKPVLKAADPGEQSNLDSDIEVFEDAIHSGQSRIDSFLASMDLHKLNTGVALRLIVFRVRQLYYDTRHYEQSKRNLMNGFGELDVPVPLPQYKPRPLAGIWAAGPFLHNGSVPTIYQLLLPAEQRDKKFFVGTRDFDPVNLGLSTDAPSQGGFWFDTSITGNSNLGHEFRKGYVEWKEGLAPQYGVIGPELSEEDRRDIIEYLKIHRDEHTIDPKVDLDGYLREGLDTSSVCQ